MLFFTLLLLSNCDGGCSNSARDRRAYYALNNKDLKIAINFNHDESSGLLLEGAELALEEVKSILPNGKRLYAEIRSDKNNINNGIINASKVSEDMSVIAVLGHETSNISVPASAIYEYSGILMMNPYATSSDLLENGYEFIFRTIPSDEAIANSLLDYFQQEDLGKIVICYESSLYGLSFANSFEKRAESIGLDIVDRVSFDIGDKREFNRIVKKWENYDYDSILFVANMPNGVNFYKVLKERGVEVPVVSGETMVEEELLNESCSVVDGLVFPAIFSHSENKPLVQSFVMKFRKRYKKDPDKYAAIAYDTIKLIAHAIKEGKSYLPEDIAKNLRKVKNFKGVTNTYNFGKNGELIMKNEDKIGVQKIQNGKFIHIGRY
ncbi:MAG TPA: hypothetical protein DEP20_00175 [Fusobacteria bacterium]|nr:hypothetical protein [Fusobacteriota bacterium]|tara:strand:- start:4036 stop:5175 length:1140 start_codon:yes stop_codon:yes gene_type:complete